MAMQNCLWNPKTAPISKCPAEENKNEGKQEIVGRGLFNVKF